MQYALIKVVNGNFSIEVETNDIKQIKVNFHNTCAALWNDSDVSLAKVAIIDQSFGILMSEFIQHFPQPEPESEPEPVEE